MTTWLRRERVAFHSFGENGFNSIFRFDRRSYFVLVRI
jgi:hypothetical protein